MRISVSGFARMSLLALLYSGFARSSDLVKLHIVFVLCIGAATAGAACGGAAPDASHTNGVPAGAATPPAVVQPGAPGQPSVVQPAGQLVPIEIPKSTPADVKFMQGMIHHHAQALEMVALLKTRTHRDDMKLLAQRIDISQ